MWTISTSGSVGWGRGPCPRGAGRGAGSASAPSGGRRSEVGLKSARVLRRELLLQELQLELEAGRGDVAARGRERGGQRREALVEAGELGVLEQRHLAQALDVGLVLDLHHGRVMAET